MIATSLSALIIADLIAHKLIFQLIGTLRSKRIYGTSQSDLNFADKTALIFDKERTQNKKEGNAPT